MELIKNVNKQFFVLFALLLSLGVSNVWGQTLLNLEDVTTIVTSNSQGAHSCTNGTFYWSAGIYGDNGANVVTVDSKNFIRLSKDADTHLKFQFTKGKIQAGDHLIMEVARCSSSDNCDLGIFTVKQTDNSYSIIDPTSAVLKYANTSDATKTYTIDYTITDNDINTVDDNTQNLILTGFWYSSTAIHSIKIARSSIYENLDLSFTYNGQTKTRQYRVYVPASVLSSSSTSVPVVFSLHGATGTNDPAAGSAQNFNTLAENNKFIVVYPQGRANMVWGTSTGWEATGADNEDTEFFRQIISDLGASTTRDLYKDNGAMKFTINSKKIYITGFSMGGMMAYACANVMPDVFAAFTSISGFPMNEMHLQHHGSRPVPFMHIHGTKDNFVKYSYTPIITDNMIFRNGCSMTPTTTTSESGATTSGGVTTKYIKKEYTGGQFPYIYYEIGTGLTSTDTGMGHESICYIDGKSSAQMFWEFMSQYSLDSSCDKTKEFDAKISTSETTARDHGWTTSSDIILAQYGESGGYTTTNENVYHSIQLNAGTHYLSFDVSGDSGNKVTVRLTRLAPLSSFDTMNETAAASADAVEVEKAYLIGDKTNICVKFTNTVASEYMLTILRASKWNNTTISNVQISTTGTATTEETDVDTDFTGYYNYNNRLFAQWNFDLCDTNRFKTSSLNSNYWSVSYTNTDTGDNTAKNGTVIYTYNKAIGNSSGTLTDANNYGQLTYDGTTVIPVSSGLKFMANANLIKIYVDLSNGNETEKHLVLGNGVKMLVPYVENSYRNDKDVADQVSSDNKSDYENCMHHIKRDILYVAMNSGNFWNKINNKCIDLTDQELFNSGGDEFVNGKTFTKHNYLGKYGTPCVIQITSEAIIDRIGINRNLTYSFYTEYINQLGYSKPQPRIRVVGSPNGQKVANIGETNTSYVNAIAMTYGGWKNTEGSYGYTAYDGTSVTDSWGTPDASADATSTPVDGFYDASQNNVAARSESLMPSSTTDNKYHEACDGKINSVNGTLSYDYIENFTPWTLPCRGGYLKFEPTIPGVLNVDIVQTKDAIYYINDEFGNLVSDVYKKTSATLSWADGGYKSDNNAYVKYSYNVYPGKTYYMFSPTAGIGFAGFYFEPYVYRTSTTDEMARQDVELTKMKLTDGTEYSKITIPSSSTRTITSPGTNGDVSYGIYSDNKAVSVTLDRSFKADTWNSICLPFSMNQNAMETVFGKGTRVVLLRDVQDGANMESGKTTANFIAHENQDIIAGYPYFICPTQNVSSISTNAYIPSTTATIPTISGLGFKTTTGVSIDQENYGGLSYYTFNGTFASETAPKGSYYINTSGSLSRCTKDTGVSIKPYRAYLKLTDSSKYAKGLEAVFFGDTDDNTVSTGVDEISIDDILMQNGILAHKANIYNLQGQIVRQNATSLQGLSKGAYIVNGKKYIVK